MWTRYLYVFWLSSFINQENQFQSFPPYFITLQESQTNSLKWFMSDVNPISFWKVIKTFYLHIYKYQIIPIFINISSIFYISLEDDVVHFQVKTTWYMLFEIMAEKMSEAELDRIVNMDQMPKYLLLWKFYEYQIIFSYAYLALKKFSNYSIFGNNYLGIQILFEITNGQNTEYGLNY